MDIYSYKGDDMQFNNILVPVDGSALSEVAIDLAFHSRDAFNSKLTFIYILDITMYNKRFGVVDEDGTRALLKTEGDIILDVAKKKAAEYGVECETLMVEGVPYMVLSEYSAKYDMMIMGVTGKTGLRRGRIGSTAEKTIENSFCPILTLKSGSQRLEKILLPVANEHEEAIDLAIGTAQHTHSSITVFSVESKVIPNAKELAEKVAEKCRKEGITTDVKIGSGSPVDSINAMSGLYDLIVMGTEGRKGLRKLFNGSVAEAVMVGASCPVTIIRNKD